jgi:hypothetical protein
VDKESCLVTYKLCHLSIRFCLQNLNPGFLIEIQRILVNVAKAWATDKMDAAETESDTDLV